jgi:hypothetical protein
MTIHQFLLSLCLLSPAAIEAKAVDLEGAMRSPLMVMENGHDLAKSRRYRGACFLTSRR